jgi:hypothetical protein
MYASRYIALLWPVCIQENYTLLHPRELHTMCIYIYIYICLIMFLRAFSFLASKRFLPVHRPLLGIEIVYVLAYAADFELSPLGWQLAARLVRSGVLGFFRLRRFGALDCEGLCKTWAGHSIRIRRVPQPRTFPSMLWVARLLCHHMPSRAGSFAEVLVRRAWRRGYTGTIRAETRSPAAKACSAASRGTDDDDIGTNGTD